MNLVCPVCDSPASLDRVCSEADIYRCGKCTHRFTDPASLKVEEHYDENYYTELHKNWFDNPDTALFDLLLDIISSHNPNASVLDVGCGKGDLLQHIHQRNPKLKLTGIDLSHNEQIEGIEILQGDILDASFNNQYDVVVNLQVIEHLIDVHSFTRRLKEVCVPGGLVIVMTVNDHSTLYGAARMLSSLGMKTITNRLYSAHHVNHFSVSSLRRLLESEGLTIEKTLLRNTPMNAVDIPSVSPIIAPILRGGVWATFALGRLTGASCHQLIVCKA